MSSPTVTSTIRTQVRTIDGLSIRLAESEPRDEHTLLLSPWPESLFAYEQMWDRLAEHARARRAGPPWFRSIVVGSGGASYPLQLGGKLQDWVTARDLDALRKVDGRQIVAGAISGLERYQLPDYVARTICRPTRATASSSRPRTSVPIPPSSRSWVTSFPRSRRQCRSSALCGTGPCRRATIAISTGSFPTAELDLVDAAHFPWEDVPGTYADLVTSWWGAH